MMARRVVRYWEKWGGQEGRAMRGIVSAFNESQDRFLVEMEQAGDWSSSPDLPRFLAAQSSGNPPDVIGLEDHQVVDLAHEGVLVPLNRYSGDIFLPAFERRHPNPQIERFRDILSTCALVSDPRVPGWLGYLERIRSAFEDIWSGRKTPAEALSSLTVLMM